MVDLENETTTTQDAVAALQNNKDPESKFCRLCLEETNLVANLYEEQPSTNDDNKVLLHERLHELFQIRYEQSQNLPSNVCSKCLEMVESFADFRESVLKIETALQKRIATLVHSGKAKVIEEPPRPGLNGQPGIFEPEENAVIIEVNPNQDYESSDDDFSMDSETENEELSNTTTKATTTADFTITTAHSTLPSDVQSADSNATIGNTLDNQTISVSKKTYTMESVPSNITYSCQYCDMAFSQQDECTEHLNTHDPTGPHVCTFCPTRYVNRQHLITHLRTAHGCDRPYICSVCNKGFVRRSDLRKHSIVHTGVRPYTCNVCGKSFSRNTNLTKHIRIHSSFKPHICVHCPRSFGTAAELMRHARSHSVVKRKHATVPAATEGINVHQPTINQYVSDPNNYALPTVNQPLATSTIPPTNIEDPYRNSILATQLQQPRAPLPPPPPQPLAGAIVAPPLLPPPQQPSTPKSSHFSRQFICEICSQSFTRERDYQRHQALHLDLLFTCKQCGIGFSRREKLARHELEHHAPQFPCNICRIPFTKVSDFELHMKMHELQQSVAMTAQAASLLSSGKLPSFNSVNQQAQQLQQQHQLQHQQQHHQAPPPTIQAPTTKDLFGLQQQQQRPSIADMNFYSQLVPTMNLGFYSETRPEDRNGI